MLQGFKGIYENGQIILSEKPHVKEKTEVIVTFLDENVFEEEKEKKTGKRILGALDGQIDIPDDWDEPLDDLKDYMY